MSIPFSKLSQEIDTTLPARRERTRRENLTCECGHFWTLHTQSGCFPFSPNSVDQCPCKLQKPLVRAALGEIAQGATVTPDTLRKSVGRRETGKDGVMRAVLDLLKARGILHFRRNVGAMRNASGRHVAFGHPGEADIEAHFKIEFPDGYFRDMVNNPILQRIVWIEVKSPIGKQSHKQEAFQRIVEAAGETYLVIRSAEQLNAWIQENI